MICRYLCIAAALPLVLGACKDDKTFADAGPDPDASGADARTDLPAVEFPTDLAIGLVDCGGTGTFTFDVPNTGGGDLDYEIASTNAAVFSISPASGTLLADTTTTFTLTATMPSDASPGTEVIGDLRITSDALAIDQVVNLHAAPRGAVLTLSPAAANFGDVELALSATRTVTVENSGNAPADVTLADPTAAEFGVAFIDGRVLANGASREITVTYTPAEEGADTASAAIAVTGPTCGAVPTSLSMSANGIPDGGVVVTGNLAFGTQTCGAVEGSAELTLFNDGNVEATWTAALADAEAPYSLSADSGTIPVGGTVVVTVTREAIELPAEPGNYDTTIELTTVGQVTLERSIPVTQLLSGPVLTVAGASEGKGLYIDFGWAPIDESLSRDLVITNSGNASANDAILQLVEGSSPTFGTAGAVTIAAAGTGTLAAEHAALVAGESVNGTIEISAPNQCSETISIAVFAGQGAWMSLDPIQEVSDACNSRPVLFGGPFIRSYLYVTNLGNEPLTVSDCAELVASDIAPVFSYNSAQDIGVDGGLGSLDLDWSNPEPLVSGSSAPSTVRCTTNERFYTTRDFDLVRTMNGADLVVTQPDGAFDFDCGDADHFKRLTITNNGNADSEYIYGDYVTPYNVYGSGSGSSVEPGASFSMMGVGIGSGTCYQGSGYFAVETGSGNVCSIDASEFPVNLTGEIEPVPPPALRRPGSAGAAPARQPTRR